MSPPALPIFNHSVDMTDPVRDPATSYRSAISRGPRSASTEQTSGDFSAYPKFDRYRRPTRPAETATAIVRELKRYRAGWNGFSAEAPREASIRDSLEFLSRTNSDASFRVDLDEDGAVNLAVDTVSGRILLTFDGDGRIAVSERSGTAWSDAGSFPIRGEVGRASPDVEQMLART